MDTGQPKDTTSPLHFIIVMNITIIILFSIGRKLKEKIYAWDLALKYDVRTQG